MVTIEGRWGSVMARGAGLLGALALGACVDVEPGDRAEPATTAVQHADEPARLTLDGWFGDNRDRLDELIATLGRGSPDWDEEHRPVVTLDWDNTITKNDTGDRFTFWMINHDKVLQPAGRDWASLSPHLSDAARSALAAACGPLAEPGEPLPTSSNPACASEIYSAYLRETTVAGLPAWRYPVVTPYANYTYQLTAQLMAGYRPHEIRAFASAAIAEGLAAPVGATTTVGQYVDNGWLRIYPQMRELIAVLQASGFDVWVITASPQQVIDAVSEELVGIPRSRVIGIRQVVEHGRLTAHTQGCGPVADGDDTMITYDEGKRCWINKVIFREPAERQLAVNPDPARRAVFAAGDSDTDIAFVKDATVLKLAINRGKIQLMCNALANHEDRWLFQPMFLLPRTRRTTPYPCSTARDARGDLIVDEVGQPIPDQLEPLY